MKQKSKNPLKNFFPLYLLIAFSYFFLISNTLSAPAFKSLDNHYGVFRTIEGNISILQKKASKKKKKAKVGMKVYPGDLIFSSKNSKAKILMIDKSLIFLSSQSKIKIQKKRKTPRPKNSTASFIPYFVYLIFGKIRSQVQNEHTNQNKYLEAKKSKAQDLKKSDLLKMKSYQVWTKSAVIGVRGTDFTVFFTPETKSTEVSAMKGEIVLYALNKKGTFFPPLFLKAGQRTIQYLHKPPNRPLTLEKKNKTTSKTHPLKKKKDLLAQDSPILTKNSLIEESSLLIPEEDFTPLPHSLLSSHKPTSHFTEKLTIQNRTLNYSKNSPHETNLKEKNLFLPIQVITNCQKTFCNKNNTNNENLKRNTDIPSKRNKNSLLIIKVKHESE